MRTRFAALYYSPEIHDIVSLHDKRYSTNLGIDNLDGHMTSDTKTRWPLRDTVVIVNKSYPNTWHFLVRWAFAGESSSMDRNMFSLVIS